MNDDWIRDLENEPRPPDLIRRVPPNNQEAERAVIGGAFLGGFKGFEVPLEPDDFYSVFHQAVFKSLLSLRDRKVPIDYLSVKNDLSRTYGDLTKAQEDGIVTLACDTVPTPANMNYYARIVLALSRKRKLIEVGARISELGYSSEKVRDLFDTANDLLFGLTADRASQRIVSGEQLAREVWEHLNNPDRETGVESGWFVLDEVIQSFRPGEVSVLAARPSMGKSSLALSVTATMLNRGERVGIVSLEMDRLQLGCNAVGSRARVDTTKVRRGEFATRDESQETVRAIEWLGGFGDALAVCDDPMNSVTELGRVLQRMVQQHQIKVAWIDYMQLLSGSERTRGLGRYAEVSEVSVMLKRFAKRFGIHLGVLAQLNREVEKRRDKKPILADLRDSGQIEQDADVIMLLHRPEYYWPDDERYQGLALLEVAKNRNGPTGTVRLRFERKFTRFEPE